MEIVTAQPGRAIVSGATSTERRLSALADAPHCAQLAMANVKGKIGAGAREAAAAIGMNGIAEAVSVGNYKPLAAYLAANLGESVLVANRSGFDALPDWFEMRILNIKAKKNGGYTSNGKPSAALTVAMTLKAVCAEVAAYATQLTEERRAARDAEIGELLGAAEEAKAA